MRLLRLDLLRYGPFTGSVLEFRPDAALHLVYGPNEAGKSSSLAAIGDLLFGFGRRKDYDFLHEAGSLRVGAEIAGRAGGTLSFRRRRGDKNTLLANSDDETALQQDALSPFIGALSREVFTRAFGLNSINLRDGGAAMLESEGEVGAALFAAASGLTGLARIQRDLEAEADQIFAPRRSKDRQFYQALDRYQTAIGAEKQNELKAGDWRRLVEEIGEIEAQLATIRQLRGDVTGKLTQLQRLRALAPIVAGIDTDLRDLEAFADLPEVPASFVTESLEAIELAEGASGRERLAEEAHAQALEAVAAVTVDEVLAARAGEVIELFSQKGDYLSKLKDLPRIEGERDEFTETLGQLAGRLGLDGAEALVTALPTDAVLENARGLVEAGSRLEQAIEADEARLRAELSSADAQDAAHSASGVSDPKPLRDQLAALAPELRQLEDRDYLEASLQNLRGKLEDGGLRLVPAVEIEKLARSPLPARASIEAQKTVLARLSDTEKAETLRLEANLEQRREAEAKLAEIAAGTSISHEEAVRVARGDRDKSFELLRQALLANGPRPPVAEMAGSIRHYQEQLGEADRLADAAIADAGRLSRLADYRDKLGLLDKERPAIEARLEALGKDKARAEQLYGGLFEAVGVKPGAPEAMLAWLGAVDDLLATRREVKALEGQIAGLERLGGELRQALLALHEAAGLTGGAALPPLALARLIRAAIEEMNERWTARLSFEGVRQATRMRIGEIEDSLGKARRDQKAWRTGYEAVLPQLRLAADTSLAAAGAALQVWAAVPDAHRERANRSARVEGMVRDIAAFETRVRELGATLVPADADLPPAALIDVLRARADDARAARARRADAVQRVEAAEGKLMSARGAHGNARAALEALATVLPAGSDAAAELNRLQQRDVLRARLAERRAALEAAAGGGAEAIIRAELFDFDAVRAPLDAEDLERQGDALHLENNKLYAQLGQKQGERERLEEGIGAELAAFERRGAETEIVASARQWAVRKIAATMLAAAIEKHRNAQADPLMLRAGELFSTLTSEAFSSLAQDYGEDDLPRLVGVRPSGEKVAVGGLSEGTRDQLYLALRLAYIEDYASRAEPVPFIGDDIFQTFDDERTAAGIRAFAKTSGLFQPILFTHHLSVVAIARRVLGEQLDYIEL